MALITETNKVFSKKKKFIILKPKSNQGRNSTGYKMCRVKFGKTNTIL